MAEMCAPVVGSEKKEDNQQALKVQLLRAFFTTWLDSELPALAYCLHEFKTEMSRKSALQSGNSIN